MANDVKLRLVDPEGNPVDLPIRQGSRQAFQIEPGYSLDFFGLGRTGAGGGGGTAGPSVSMSGQNMVLSFPSGAEVQLLSYGSAAASTCPPKVAYHSESLEEYLEKQEEKKEEEKQEEEENKQEAEENEEEKKAEEEQEELEEDKEKKPKKDKLENEDDDLEKKLLDEPEDPKPPLEPPLEILDSDTILNFEEAKPKEFIEFDLLERNPEILVNDVIGIEADQQFVFTVTRKGNLEGITRVAFSVEEITGLQTGIATDGNDFIAKKGILEFLPGETTKNIIVDILDDNFFEGPEKFQVKLVAIENATIFDPVADGVITNLADRPTLAVSDPTVNEGLGTVDFVISLTGQTILTTTVDYTTLTKTAVSGTDFTATTGQVTFAPGETQKTVSVPITNDLNDEIAETFLLRLSNAKNAVIADNEGEATIIDDDPGPTININDVFLSEATANAVFTVSLNVASGKPITVDFVTTNLTAQGGIDYTTTTQTVTFAPGQTTANVNVPIIQDTLDENNETFQATLSNAVNATIGDGTGVATITDDDPTPTLSILSVPVDEEQGTISFKLQLDVASGRNISVDVFSSDGTATAGTDYTPIANTTINFAPGQTTQTVSLAILPDMVAEVDETFNLNLVNPVNVTLNANSATGVIIDNAFTVLNGIPGDDGSSKVGFAGDFNGDGLSDIAVGTASLNGGLGLASVTFGNQNDIPTPFNLSQLQGGNGGDGTAGQILLGGEPNVSAGISVSSADINGDGISDILIGEDAQSAVPASAIVVLGSQGARPPEFELSDLDPANSGDGSQGTIFNGEASDITSFKVGSAGDINSDGLEDILIGSFPVGTPGHVYVVKGKQNFGADFELSSLRATNGGTGVDGMVLKGDAAGDYTGFSVSSAGDINGDGFDDIIVGAPQAGLGGRAYVVFGTANNPADFELSSLLAINGGDGSQGFVINAVAANNELGISVSGGADINNDGVDDIIVGAERAAPNGLADGGEAYVIFGKTTPFAPEFNASQLLATNGGDGSQGFVVKGVAIGDYTGASVSTLKDINGDGFDDIVIGAPFADPSGINDAGVVSVVFGGDTIPAEVEISALSGLDGFNIDGLGVGDNFGRAVSGAGDVNGDGFYDLTFSAPGALSSDGQHVIVYGRDYLGLVDFRGLAQNDNFMGLAQDEVFVTGAGDDTAIGNGGGDIFRMGLGDDVINVPDFNFVIADGGTGIDTLEFDGAGLNLDFTNLPTHAVTGIDIIDITGTGDNDLTLRLSDIFQDSDGNQLVIKGDVGDTATINLPNTFVNLGSVGGFTSFSNGVGTLVVSDDIDQSGIVILP